MDVAEFVEQALLQVHQGVSAAGSKVRSGISVAGSNIVAGSSRDGAIDVEFDLPVAIEARPCSANAARITVLEPVGADEGADGRRAPIRLRFRVPLSLPRPAPSPEDAEEQRSAALRLLERSGGPTLRRR